jgi:hypothetical protein
MNSILQCLSNFNHFATFFIDRLYEDHINEKSETRGHVAIEFSEVVRALWAGQYKSISPVDFRQTIGRYKKNFRGNEQQVPILPKVTTIGLQLFVITIFATDTFMLLLIYMYSKFNHFEPIFEGCFN